MPGSAKVFFCLIASEHVFQSGMAGGMHTNSKTGLPLGLEEEDSRSDYYAV